MSSVPPKWTPNYKQATQFEAWRLAEMVDRLPAVIWDMDNSELIRQAALECFFVHVRTLIEFLGIRRPHPRDRSARDTLTNTSWTPTLDAALRARLDADWGMVSQHLVHFSKARVVDETGRFVVPSTDRSSLERIANDVLEVWDQYAKESNDLLVPHRAKFAVYGRYQRLANTPGTLNSPATHHGNVRMGGGNRWLNCLLRCVRNLRVPKD